MQDQLVDKYLNRHHTCKHGIYLVGYFRSDRWVDEDYRKKDCTKYDLNQLRESLTETKNSFSSNARHIC